MSWNAMVKHVKSEAQKDDGCQQIILVVDVVDGGGMGVMEVEDDVDREGAMGQGCAKQMRGEKKTFELSMRNHTMHEQIKGTYRGMRWQP